MGSLTREKQCIYGDDVQKDTETNDICDYRIWGEHVEGILLQASILSPIRFESFGEEAKIADHTKGAVSYKDKRIANKQVSIIRFGVGVLSDYWDCKIVEVETASKIAHQSPKLGPEKDDIRDVGSLRVLFFIFGQTCCVLGLGDPHKACDNNKDTQNDDSCNANRV